MYQVREGIILRDIAGIYFLIDIHKKNCYDLQKIDTVNEIGKEVFGIIMNQKNITLDEIIDKLTAKIINYTPDMREKISNDISKFVEQMVDKGYIIKMN